MKNAESEVHAPPASAACGPDAGQAEHGARATIRDNARRMLALSCAYLRDGEENPFGSPQ